MHIKTSDTNFERISPFNITPVKRAHKAELGHAGIVDYSNLSIKRLNKKYIKRNGQTQYTIII